jgi:ligand-binding SRPBCC domain-containing protein
MNSTPVAITRDNNDYLLRTTQDIPGTLEDVFAFFKDPRNLERITPPLLKLTIVDPDRVRIHQNARINYKLRIRGLPIRWRTRITNWNPPYSFTDVQERGPYRLWEHTHIFAQIDQSTVRCTDTVRYRVPGGAIAHRLLVRGDLVRIFTHRQSAIAKSLGTP